MKRVASSLSGSSAERPADGAYEPSAEQPGFTITIVSAMTGVHMMCAANVGPELKIGDLKCLLPDYAVDSSTVVAATTMRFFGDSVEELQDKLGFHKQLPYKVIKCFVGEMSPSRVDEARQSALECTAECDELVGLIGRVPEHYGCGVLLIEHNMRVIMNACAQIHVIDSGRTIAEGTPAEIQEHPDVVRAYLGSKSETGNARG